MATCVVPPRTARTDRSVVRLLREPTVVRAPFDTAPYGTELTKLSVETIGDGVPAAHVRRYPCALGTTATRLYEAAGIPTGTPQLPWSLTSRISPLLNGRIWPSGAAVRRES